MFAKLIKNHIKVNDNNKVVINSKPLLKNIYTDYFKIIKTNTNI